MSDLVERLRERAKSLRGLGGIAHTDANQDDEAADEIERLSEANAQVWADNERLRAYALKAFTVVEFCAGEGLLLPHPHYDCDDLLMEGVDLLKVETSEEARAALAQEKPQ